MFVEALWLLLSSALAASPESSCQSFKNYREFYQCSLLKHPEFEISKLKLKEGEALVSEASSWKNPELELKSVRGKSDTETSEDTELSLSVPVSQVWTRGPRKEIGQAQKKIAEIESSQALLNVRKKLILDLYRLRQIEEELHTFEESLASFETIRKQFRARAARGPEQEVTLNLVELATSDYELKKNHLVTERLRILSGLAALWGPNFKVSKEILPGYKEKWPDLTLDSTVAQSFEIQKLVAEAERANAEKKLADREAFPELSVGPTIEQANEGGNRVTSYGVNLNMTLPIFSQNRGSRKLAETRATQAALQSQFAVKRSELEKEVLLQKYRSSVAALKKSSNKEDVHKKHTKIDGLFRQGLVSGSLVIEAHRQIVDFTESQHAHELLAIESFLELKTLSGGNVEEIL